jgi:hypothetical protein
VLPGSFALLADLLAVAMFVGLHSLPTGLSPVADPVSRYGISRFARGYRVLTLAMAAAGAAVAVGIASALPGLAASTVVYVWVFAIARAVISWFPMDEPGTTPPTPHGRRHTWIAIVTFLAAVLMSRQLAGLLGATGAWPATRAVLDGLAVFLVVAVLLAAAALVWEQGMGGHRSFGLAERGLYLGIFAWLGVVGWSLVTA